MMQFYFAPMEGITGYVFRNAYHHHFGPADRYYTPFLSPNQNRRFTSRELEDVRPEHNRDIPVVPQVLTNRAEDFLWAADRLEEMGWEEVNLNLGCPSATVVTKGRGAGFLEDPGKLDQFLETVSDGLRGKEIRLSVKTRIGLEDPEEFAALLPVFNRYPMERLIIHPRVREDFYRNRPNWDVFAWALETCVHPVCYNGDLFSLEDIQAFRERFPRTEAVMLGRGLLAYPGLIQAARDWLDGVAAGVPAGEAVGAAAGKGDGEAGYRARLGAFHQEVLEGYRQAIPGDRNVLFKMKELWSYLAFSFEGAEKPLKKLKKAQRMADYQAAAAAVLEDCPLAERPGFRGF